LINVKYFAITDIILAMAGPFICLGLIPRNIRIGIVRVLIPWRFVTIFFTFDIKFYWFAQRLQSSPSL